MIQCIRCGSMVNSILRGLCRRCVGLEADAISFTNSSRKRKCKLCNGGPALEGGPNVGFCLDCVDRVFKNVEQNVNGKCKMCGGGPAFASGFKEGLCQDCAAAIFEAEVGKEVEKAKVQVPQWVPSRDSGPGSRCGCRHLRSNHTSGGCVIYLEDASGWCPCALTPSAFVIGGRKEGKKTKEATSKVFLKTGLPAAVIPASWERMTFGRYDGWSVGDIPDSYLLWAARLAGAGELATASPALRAALVAEAKRRGLDLSKLSDFIGRNEAAIVEPREATPRRPQRLIGGEV